MAWELHGFGSCVAAWLDEQPPIEWRRLVNEWVRSLEHDPFGEAEREPALDEPGWSGWLAEIPGAQDAIRQVVAYFYVSAESPLLDAQMITALPRFRE
ncbi:MAG: hypothetical protein ACRD12_08120 [Acidimicrobiales bacterium]